MGPTLSHATKTIANIHSSPLEDLDRYFAEAKGVIVAFDKAAVSTKRPVVYAQEEADQVAKLHGLGPADKMEKSDYAAKHIDG